MPWRDKPQLARRIGAARILNLGWDQRDLHDKFGDVDLRKDLAYKLEGEDALKWWSGLEPGERSRIAGLLKVTVEWLNTAERIMDRPEPTSLEERVEALEAEQQRILADLAALAAAVPQEPERKSRQPEGRTSAKGKRAKGASPAPKAP